ncbi:MAG: PEP-CTERM sorting domain-containing protein [Planctomycetales bacterium]|nr:PEP-CTERM sorting domain-containing protein [Planctomycetales bacterium]
MPLSKTEVTNGARVSVSAVPEPSSGVLLMLGIMSSSRLRKRNASATHAR